MSEELLLVVSTWPDAETARRVGRVLVEERLAACANIIPGIESIYRWDGRIETAGEVMVLLKSTRRSYPALQARITELHPYEVPEILAFSPAAGLPAYCRWAIDACGEKAIGEKGN